MALTKVTKTGITDNAIDADKLEDGTIIASDIAPGTITDAKLNSTLDLSGKTVTLPNTSVTNDMLAGSIANAKLANPSITINGSSVSLGGSFTAKHIDWQSVVTADGSTTTTAVAGEGYFIDTTSAAHTITLPASPSIGDTVAIKDYAGTFGTNVVTILRNSENIQGVANDSQVGTNRASVVLVYIDSTKGWLYTNESNVANLEYKLYISASGGTETTSGDYKIHSFTGDGCFTVSSLGNCAGGGTNLDYVVVAGGGGGATTGSEGEYGGGAGGAGGYREGKDSCAASPHSASPLAASTGITATVTTYPITVGGGGSGAGPGNASGTTGSNSVFSTITSAGGGGGGNEGPTSAKSGGSGGGAGARGGPAGSGNTPPVSPPQGNNGNNPSNDGGGAGGGAAGGGGGTLSPNTGGIGGASTPSSITGSSVFRSGGGSGGSRIYDGPAPAEPGGSGGVGGRKNTPAGNGTANTGGGGGGAAVQATSGSGGKGIVIIRYKYQN